MQTNIKTILFKLAAFVLSAILSHLIISPLHIGDERYSTLRPYSIEQDTGSIRFIPRYKGNIAFIELTSSNGKTLVACPINTKKIPCNDPKTFFEVLHKENAGTITYLKYSKITPSSGAGEILAIKTKTWEASENIQDIENRADKITPIFLETVLALIIYFIANSIATSVIGSRHAKHDI